MKVESTLLNGVLSFLKGHNMVHIVKSNWIYSHSTILLPISMEWSLPFFFLLTGPGKSLLLDSAYIYYICISRKL